MKRYASKLLFQFRAVAPGKSRRLRTVEERIVLMKARSARAALVKAKTLGRKKEFAFDNNEGNRVYFEFIGVMDLMELGPEAERDEVWYTIREMLLPMERRKAILPKEANLSAIVLEAKK